jgi:hypothetical protein
MFIPERWALEGLAVLEENAVMAQLVHRDFSNEVAQAGDVVNTRRVGTFKSYRKTDSDSITLQDASATNIPVSLNMHNYASFTIKDGEASKSFKDLVDQHLRPAAQGIARGIDRMLIGQAPRFATNASGKLNGVTYSTVKDYILEGREVLNRNNAYMQDRRLVLGPAAETLMLKTDMFVKANERGDSGQALEDARLGRLLGFDIFMDQNAPGLSSADVVDSFTGVVDLAAGYPAGTTSSMTVNILAHEVTAGEFVVFEEDGQLTYATAATASTNTTAVTLNQALKYAVTNAAAVTAYGKCEVDGNYASGYTKAIVLDGYTASKPPQVGQVLAFGANAALRHTYVITEAFENPSNSSQTLVYLDRALEAAVADGGDAFPGPIGGVNLMFHRDAIALVSRPLAMPRGNNVMASVVDYNGISMRIAMQYDITTQGTIVTADLLCGVQVLDANLGCVLYT